MHEKRYVVIVGVKPRIHRLYQKKSCSIVDENRRTNSTQAIRKQKGKRQPYQDSFPDIAKKTPIFFIGCRKQIIIGMNKTSTK